MHLFTLIGLRMQLWSLDENLEARGPQSHGTQPFFLQVYDWSKAAGQDKF